MITPSPPPLCRFTTAGCVVVLHWACVTVIMEHYDISRAKTCFICMTRRHSWMEHYHYIAVWCLLFENLVSACGLHARCHLLFVGYTKRSFFTNLKQCQKNVAVFLNIVVWFRSCWYWWRCVVLYGNSSLSFEVSHCKLIEIVIM